ncbi:MAG: glucosaminidase domain-containing protein [Ferruginibacter sp.]
MTRIGIAMFFCMLANLVYAQQLSPEAYIGIYKDLAIKEMKRSGIPASITLAQGLLETESGNSPLVKKSNNHFGIKCKSNWTGESVSHTDDAPNECFRKYATADESYADHSNFLKGSARYASLFSLSPNDYKGWAHGLKRAGYATNPRYPQILISHIEKYNLQQFDDTAYISLPEDMATKAAPEIETVAKEIPVPAVTETMVIKKDAKLLSSKMKFNGIKALFAPAGTSLLAIATANDLPLVKLLEYNDLKSEGLLKQEQVIYLDKKAKQGNKDHYISLQNETLYDVAQNFGIQLTYLVQYNNMPETAKVKKGQKILLKPAFGTELSK